jgi:Flp pilus assembly secretin CpaC
MALLLPVVALPALADGGVSPPRRVAPAPPPPAPEPVSHIRIDLNHTLPVPTLADAAAVVVGNPAIADATVFDLRTVLLTARGPGVTNLLVLDAKGKTVMNATVEVSTGPYQMIHMQRGDQASQLACNPVCVVTALPTAGGALAPAN